MTVGVKAYLAIEKSLSERLIKAWEAHSRPLLQHIWNLMREGRKHDAVDAANAIDLEPLIKNNKEFIDYIGHAALLFGATRVTRDPRKTRISQGKHGYVVQNATTLLQRAVVNNVEEAIRKALLIKIAAWDIANPTTHFGPREPEALQVQKFDPEQPRDAHGRWTAAGGFEDSLGIARVDMPQIRAKDMPDFFNFAAAQGVHLDHARIDAKLLKPAQREFNPEQVAQMRPEALAKPITVSADNYILDGTNRWVRIMQDHPDMQVEVVRIGAKAHDALKLMHSFPKSFSKDVSMVGRTEDVRKEEPVEKRDLGDYVEPFVSFQGDVFNQAEGLFGLTSALHTSRLSAFGFTVEADVRNLDTYEIDAQLDNRTCPVCEIMNGKQFPIETASRLLTAALGADNPDDLKTIQPWPPQDKRSVEEIAQMSDDDLVARGWNVPPFHPWCRCLLSAVGEGTPTDETPSARAAAGILPDEMAAAALVGAPLADLTMSDINDIRDTMAGLDGQDAADAWQGLLDEGYTTEELESVFDVSEDDVLAGNVSFSADTQTAELLS